jgi:hypothetical protein
MQIKKAKKYIQIKGLQNSAVGKTSNIASVRTINERVCERSSKKWAIDHAHPHNMHR